jgi:hypothetical protein
MATHEVTYSEHTVVTGDLEVGDELIQTFLPSMRREYHRIVRIDHTPVNGAQVWVDPPFTEYWRGRWGRRRVERIETRCFLNGETHTVRVTHRKPLSA